MLHESARAVGGALSQAPRWEIVQLGSGSATEGVAQLFQEVTTDPAWLREHTALRGEPLDDLVHVQATRRLLAARRAAALVIFEVKRRDGPQTAEANAALYKDLIQRATLATMTDEDAGRWALESDEWMRAAGPRGREGLIAPPYPSPCPPPQKSPPAPSAPHRTTGHTSCSA